MPSELAELLSHHGADVPLDHALVAVVRAEFPEVDGPPLLARLDELAHGIRATAGVPPFETIARLNHRLFEEEGFTGDVSEYDRPENSYLHTVLERKKGLPILLSSLYLEVARRADLPMVGIGFPGHFLIRLKTRDPLFFIDPFNRGRILQPERLRARLERMTGEKVDDETFERCTAPVDHRYILVRMHNNLRGSYLAREDLPRALRVIERLQFLAPELRSEWRESGLIRAALGDTTGAIQDLQTYLLQRESPPDLQRVVAILEVLKRRAMDISREA